MSAGWSSRPFGPTPDAGPTVAALTRNPSHASDVAERLRAARPDDPAPLIARGAVPGALIMAT